MSKPLIYPIDSNLPDVLAVLEEAPGVVLQAPPGAGKTTRVPLALLNAEWVGERKIVMLEPRRMAARAAARFMAASLGEQVGATVGYRVKLDSRVSPTTRIEVVTEGVLTRMLQDDPELQTVAAVIFDEFHERSLQSDLGLAMCLEVQKSLRADLRLVVMSATLDGEAVARLLDNAPIVTSAGRAHPVDVRYAPVKARFALGRRAFCNEVAMRLIEVLREETGNVLVFLPGVAEIRQVETALHLAGPGDQVIVAPLHGQLPADAQDRAIQLPPGGQRKVVLATSIAETSLTIEGVRVVLDCGLMRMPGFDPVSGLTRLDTLPVSQAAADQRCGRAGRQQPGICYRLWPRHQHLLAFSAPEILQADLAPLVLELAHWGLVDVGDLRILDQPPPAHLAQATELLIRLGALHRSGLITAQGREMLRLGAHPRLAHMMLRAKELGLAALASDLAALIAEPGALRSSGASGADLDAQLELMRSRDHDGRRVSGVARLQAESRRWQQRLHCAAAPPDQQDLRLAGVVLGFAYPDRIGQRRAGVGANFLLSNGRGARFPSEDEPLAASDYIVAAHLDGTSESRIFLACAIYPEDVARYYHDLVTECCFVQWDTVSQSVQARRQLRLGELVLEDAPWQQADSDAVHAAMLEGVRRNAPECLPWTDAARQLQARIRFVRRDAPGQWPDFDDARLTADLDEWLSADLHGMTRLAQLKRLDLHGRLLAMLSWPQRQALDKLAPCQLTVPSGSRISIDYSSDIPVLAVKLQEMFGLTETPKIAAGRVAVLLHLLSPARRPVQITRDLGAFWRGAYHEVRKELKGRYPKHDWPLDPLAAIPSARVRRQT
ncbi:MAG: ATP-dependent helicase HrpB [Thiogranum sp.]|nr:ATP-dependent helicase HrpB [Thiogranum sp.]